MSLDTYQGLGMYVRPEILPTEDILYEALRALDPLHLWHYAGLYMTPAVAGDNGYGAVNMAMSGTLTSYLKGPDDRTYPSLGLTTPDFYGVTQSEILANGYTTGYTVVIVLIPYDANVSSNAPGSNPTVGALDSGSIFFKDITGSPTVRGAETVGFDGTGYLYGQTTQSTGLPADLAYSNSVNKVALWTIIEAYFPPGDSTPILYRNGSLITGGDLNVVNSAVRTNHGDGLVYVGKSPSASWNDMGGAYAMCAIYEGALTSGDRTSYKNAGLAEGWLPIVAESFFLDAIAASGEITVGSYDDVIIIASGIFRFVTGAFGDPGGWGSNGGDLEVPSWTALTPIGAPFSGPQGGRIYSFAYNGGGNPITLRIGDSFHGDNLGGYTIHIIEV